MKLSCLPLAELNSFLLWTNQTPGFTHEHTLAILMNCARISALVLGFSSFRISLTTQKLVCRSGRRRRGGRERRMRREKWGGGRKKRWEWEEGEREGGASDRGGRRPQNNSLILKRVTAVPGFIISCIMCQYCTLHVNAAVYIVKLVYTINYNAAVHSHDWTFLWRPQCWEPAALSPSWSSCSWQTPASHRETSQMNHSGDTRTELQLHKAMIYHSTQNIKELVMFCLNKADQWILFIQSRSTNCSQLNAMSLCKLTNHFGIKQRSNCFDHPNHERSEMFVCCKLA